MVCFSVSYAEDTTVVSQGGPLGTTSIGDQNIQAGAPAPASAQQSISTADQQQALLLELQKQVHELQGQLKQIKVANNSQQQAAPNGRSGSGSGNGSGGGSFTTYSSMVDNRSDVGIGGAEPNSDDILSNINSDNTIINLGNNSGGMFAESGGIDVGGSPLITSGGQVSYLGAYSGNNSIPIGAISSSLFASTLLGQRSKFDDYSIFFGGIIQADAQIWSGSQITKNNGGTFAGNGQNIYLNQANLYFLSNLGHYVTAQFDFDANEGGNFSLGNAFVIFGNMDTSPWFATVGKNQLSVGTFGGGGPYASGITNFLKPGSVTNVSVNYKADTFNMNVAVFGANDNSANFSTGLFYADALTEDLSAGLNAGYVYDLQGAANAKFANFDNAGAFNVDGTLAYAIGPGTWQFQGGWATATGSNDYNGNGGSTIAGAWYVGSNYSLALYGKNTNFNVTYGQSYNAAVVPMAIAASPINFGGLTASGIANQLLFSAQRSYFDDNVLFGPEYVYQKFYNGQYMNTVTLDMSVYI
jgi:hypothetical protein